MKRQGSLFIVGASTRAAAFSALRAGLMPWCADLFADADLEARCPVRRVPPEDYPAGFVEPLTAGVSGPWMYTGGLENHPYLVRSLSNARPLWGVRGESLERARSPWIIREILSHHGIPCP